MIPLLLVAAATVVALSVVTGLATEMNPPRVGYVTAILSEAHERLAESQEAMQRRYAADL